MQHTVSVINYLLGIAIIALTATIVTDRLSERIDRTFTAREPAAVSAPALPEALSFYSPILANGLFGPASRGQLTPLATATNSALAAPATAPAELLLLGTVVGTFRDTFALVRHTTKNEERVYRLGEAVFDAGRLAEVTRDRAFIVVSGKKVELLTPMTPPAAAVGHAAPAHSASITGAGAGSYVIDQRALNAALDNPTQAMSDARLLPTQKEGRVEGFRASEVRHNGVFFMLGIKNGDILLKLNDFPIDSPDRALQSLVALKGQNRLKLDLVRDGQPHTFIYDIR